MTQKNQAANEKLLLTSRKVMKPFFYLILSRSFGLVLRLVHSSKATVNEANGWASARHLER